MVASLFAALLALLVIRSVLYNVSAFFSYIVKFLVGYLLVVQKFLKN